MKLKTKNWSPVVGEIVVLCYDGKLGRNVYGKVVSIKGRCKKTKATVSFQEWCGEDVIEREFTKKYMKRSKKFVWFYDDGDDGVYYRMFSHQEYVFWGVFYSSPYMETKPFYKTKMKKKYGWYVTHRTYKKSRDVMNFLKRERKKRWSNIYKQMEKFNEVI